MSDTIALPGETSGVLHCDVIYGKWVYITWTGPDENKIKSRKEMIGIEKGIRNKNLRGWIADSGKQYKKMHRILLKLGAKIYAEDKETLYFMKEISNGKIG